MDEGSRCVFEKFEKLSIFFRLNKVMGQSLREEE
jgi:hypothetical protein